MAKPKQITSLVGTSSEDHAQVCTALNARFSQFTFTVSGDHVVAEGPWELKANERPAMGTMSAFAEGYVKAIADSK